MKVVARCFLSGTLKAMLTLVLFVFVLVWAELTQWFPQRVFVELSLQCRVICWVYHFCDTVGLCHFWFFANLGLQASQGRTDIVNNTSLHQTRESNIKLQDQALVTRLSHPHARNSGDMSQRPSVADPRNRNSQLSSGESLESQWDLFQKYLKIGKVQDPDPAVQQSALKPPPSKSQKGLQIAGAPADSKPSFVDDILSGLGSLSRAQVKGSKELPLNASKRSRPSWYQVSPLTNSLWAGCCAYEFVIIIGLCTVQHQVRCWHTVRHFVISILNWGGVWNGHKRLQRIARWVSIDSRMDSFCK